MRSVKATYFCLGENLSCITGLRYDSDFILQPFIALVSYEEVIFTVEEWKAFCQLKYELNRYFHRGVRDFEHSTNKEILFNNHKKEVVLKCPRHFNTVKINQHQFNRLMNLEIIIMRYVQKLQDEITNLVEGQSDQLLEELLIVYGAEVFKKWENQNSD